jgi:hypothetical protein
MVEHLTTQKIIGKAETVQRKELGEGNTGIWDAKLFYSSVADTEPSAHPSLPNSDLLY